MVCPLVSISAQDKRNPSFWWYNRTIGQSLLGLFEVQLIVSLKLL